MIANQYGIETYPVGLFADIKQRRIKSGVRYLYRQAKCGNWRAVRNYFNGYLAEWNFPPDGMMHHRCGKGWTRRRARRSLGQHLINANLSIDEQEKIS